jgi:hypothetical protein
LTQCKRRAWFPYGCRQRATDSIRPGWLPVDGDQSYLAVGPKWFFKLSNSRSRCQTVLVPLVLPNQAASFVRQESNQPKYPSFCPRLLRGLCLKLLLAEPESLALWKSCPAAPSTATPAVFGQTGCQPSRRTGLALSACRIRSDDRTPESESESVMILPQVHLRKPCYDFYFLEMFSIDELPRHSQEACASRGSSPNVSTKHPLGSSDGRCVQRAGT